MFRPTTKLATLPLITQEQVVTKIGRCWLQMSRAEQDLTRALYNQSYRYNDGVSSTLRLYALQWCDVSAQGKSAHFSCSANGAQSLWRALSLQIDIAR